MTEPESVEVFVTRGQLALLNKLDFPCSERLLASVEPCEDEGVLLVGSRAEVESLAGWVAGETNHTRASRKADLLHDLADRLECCLG